MYEKQNLVKSHSVYKIEAAIWQYFQGDGEGKDAKLTLSKNFADFIVDTSFFLTNYDVSRFPHFLMFS